MNLGRRPVSVTISGTYENGTLFEGQKGLFWSKCSNIRRYEFGTVFEGKIMYSLDR